MKNSRYADCSVFKRDVEALVKITKTYLTITEGEFVNAKLEYRDMNFNSSTAINANSIARWMEPCASGGKCVLYNSLTASYYKIKNFLPIGLIKN